MNGHSIPEAVDTVIVGNGPSALILSFILHGNIPYYNSSNPHPDPILHRKLSQSPCLLDVDFHDLTAHFAASRLSYSTQALPINVLLDTLLRPLHDTDPGKYQSCVGWKKDEAKAVSHVALGNTTCAGGQWADNPVSASWDIGALSYAEMLSLPGYTFDDHYKALYERELPDFHRPSRREVATYLATYPTAVGIEGAIYTDNQVEQVSRASGGFHVRPHNLTCKHLVLASGVFSDLIPPRLPLQPLSNLPSLSEAHEAPVLVVGSGFTAADVILSTPPSRRIIHIFKWSPEDHPSPLRACHPRAYPEYASVYKHMKLAARAKLGSLSVTSPMRLKRSNPFFQDRDWDSVYEGLPNTYIKDVSMQYSHAILTLEDCHGSTLERQISRMEYVIGRRGSLSYLSQGIAHEMGFCEGDPTIDKRLISGHTLRAQIKQDVQVGSGIFAIGSLTGDSLIRFAFGGCVLSAGAILNSEGSASTSAESSPVESCENLSSAPSSPIDPQLENHGSCYLSSAHFDDHLDKQKRSDGNS